MLQRQVEEEAARVTVQQLHGAGLGPADEPIGRPCIGCQAPVDGSEKVFRPKGWVSRVSILLTHPGDGGFQVSVGSIARGVTVEVEVNLKGRLCEPF